MNIEQYSPKGEAMLASMPTLTSRLRHQKEDLEARLNKVNKALGLLEKNPELQELFDAVAQV